MRPFLTFFAASLTVGTVAYGCSSSTNGGGGGGGADGGSDGAPHKDATGPYDSGGSGDDSSAGCPTPADVSKFTAPAYKHAAHSPTACTAQNITDYDNDCLNQTTRNTTACSAWKTANATCYACLVTPETNATWGALTVHNGVLDVNTAGCVELTDPSDTTCAPAYQAGGMCIEAACDTQCPVSSGDQVSFSNYQQCATTASSQGCGTLVNAGQTACKAAAASATSAFCFPPAGGSFDPFFLQVAPIFCGGAASDGGSEAAAPDSGGDAASD
jgi:hypothetical protein